MLSGEKSLARFAWLPDGSQGIVDDTVTVAGTRELSAFSETSSGLPRPLPGVPMQEVP